MDCDREPNDINSWRISVLSDIYLPPVNNLRVNKYLVKLKNTLSPHQKKVLQTVDKTHIIITISCRKTGKPLSMDRNIALSRPIRGHKINNI